MNERNGFDDIDVLLSGIPGKTSRGFLGYCTVVLFLLDGEWALFDTGHQADRHLLVDALTQRALTPADIKHVVLSHLHFDHILNLPLFKRAKVYISQAELDYAKLVCEGDHH
ncbi:MAG: MBL fold metallo-hydrolase, partial [Desulfohalobiaceae bacterium]|nr:MBL fold metallo-hydrolase [Desulfohalobiaceae bacterium]